MCCARAWVQSKGPPLLQPYNDILERAGRSCVEGTMCVCYELMQTAGGRWGASPMEGRRVRFLRVISVSIIFLMAHNARSQSRSTPAEKIAATKGSLPAKSGIRKLSAAANAWVETTL